MGIELRIAQFSFLWFVFVVSFIIFYVTMLTRFGKYAGARERMRETGLQLGPLSCIYSVGGYFLTRTSV